MFGRKKKNEIIVKLDELPALTEQDLYQEEVKIVITDGKPFYLTA